MAGRGDKIWHHDTEVKPNYEKLDELARMQRNDYDPLEDADGEDWF